MSATNKKSPATRSRSSEPSKLAKKKLVPAKKKPAPKAAPAAIAAPPPRPEPRRASSSAAGSALGFDWDEAVAHISAKDPKLAALIARVGPTRLEIRGLTSPFEALVRSIVYQQLTGKAAGTIHGRLVALFPESRLAPELLLAHADDVLRAAGLSRGKIAALRDLAARTLDGTVPAAGELGAMHDDAIVERLVCVRGVGRWTVEMLLIFGLGRPDVLPVHDYGVRSGFKATYRKTSMPTPKDIEAWAERWRPYRTVGSWYMWRAVELERREAKEAKDATGAKGVRTRPAAKPAKVVKAKPAKKMK